MAVKRGSARCRQRRKAIRDGMAAFLVFFVLALVFTYPVVRCLPSCVPDPGDPLLNSWILAWDVHKLTTGLEGFFDTNIFYPHANTLAYSESQLASALLAAPVLMVSHNPVLAHNVVYLVSFVLSGFGMYLLVKHLTNSGLAGIVAGIVFAFCPYKTAHFQLQMVSTQWMPFALLFLDRLLRRQRWMDCLWFTLFFNLQALSSYYYALFFAVAIGVLIPVYLWTERGRMDSMHWSSRLVPQFACFVALTLLVNVPLAVPYFELSRMGFTRSRETTLLFGATFADYLTVAPWNLLYGSLTTPLRGVYWSEHTSFPGVVAFVLALVGIAGGRRSAGKLSQPNADKLHPFVLPYTCVLVAAVILALGTSWDLPGTDLQLTLPFGLLFDHVPGFRGLRAPSRFNLITMLALAVLGGYGVSRLQQVLKGRPLALRAIASLTLPVLVGVEYLAIPLPYDTMVAREAPAVYDWLAGLEEESVIIELPFPSTPGGDPDWGAFAYSEGWRVYFSTVHWNPMVNGYSGFLPPGYAETVKDMLGFPDRSSIDRLHEMGVSYVVLHRDMLDQERRPEVEDDLQGYSDELVPVGEFGDDLVLEVLPQGGRRVRDLIKETSFGGKTALIGFSVGRVALHAGDSFTLTLLWRAADGMEEDYTVFVHLLDAEGRLQGQHDGQPQGGQAPTSTWHRGQIVRDQHRVVVSPEAPPGSYRVVIGLYSLLTMERLPVVDGQGQILDDKVPLMEVRIADGDTPNP